jgi:hypothetical protein
MMFHPPVVLYSAQVIELGIQGPHMLPLFTVLEVPVATYQNLL